MIATKIKQLTKAQARIAKLERSIAKQLATELARLPARYGFTNVKSFLHAVRSAVGGEPPRRPSRGARKSRRSRKRAVITDAMRAEVKRLVEVGKTGREIAAALRISQPSVAVIKKALGLTKKRLKA